MAYKSLADVENALKGLSEEDQRLFMRRLAVETHVRFELHLEEERVAMNKLDDVHKALFDPENGLVHLKSWMCRLAKSAAWIAGGALSGLAAVATIGHQFGIW